jgi:hypothetical protein
MRIKLWAGLMGKYPAYVLVPCPSAYWVDCPSYPGTLVLLGYFRYAVERGQQPNHLFNLAIWDDDRRSSQRSERPSHLARFSTGSPYPGLSSDHGLVTKIPFCGSCARNTER